MILFKALQEFLLPSVFSALLMALGLIFLLIIKKKKAGEVLIVIGLFSYYFFFISPFLNLVIEFLEKQYDQINEDMLREVKKVVLLLGNRESSILRGGEVQRIYFLRSFLYNQGTQVIISGTSLWDSGRGGWLKEYLSERGIAPEDITLESKSRNTFESAKKIKEIISEEPFFLVTSAYHMPRSMESFLGVGANPIPAPIDFKAKGKNYDWLSLFPSAFNLEKADLAFHEYFGIIFYRLKRY